MYYQRFLLLASLILALIGYSARADVMPAGRHPDVSLLPRGYSQLYDETTLFPQPTGWKQIPWLTNLKDAIAAGKKENRPILIWVAGDNPLERC